MKWHGARGFTLVELALVFIIVAFLLGGLLMPLTMQIEQQKTRETQKAMEDIKEALIGYALNHQDASGRPYLPCPDRRTGGAATSRNDGLEDRAGGSGACSVTVGNLPWATLGVNSVDAWGNYYTYRVIPEYSNSSAGFALGMPIATTTDNRVYKSTTLAVNIAPNAPVVVVSHGANGFYAISGRYYRQALPGGYPAAPPTGRSSLDEAENGNGDRIFIRPDGMRDIGATAGEFDDLVTWLSPNILFNRMVAAGRLP